MTDPRPLLSAALVLALVAASVDAQDPHPGRPLYDKWCAGCHGVEGDGRGPAAGFMLPPPRDFTRAAYQIRSTATGELPTDADIRRVIDDGMPGTAMPGWKTTLTPRQRDDLVAYLKTFSRFFEDQPPEPLRFGRAPRGGDEAIAEGRRVYETLECWRCHGQQGRGDGVSAPTLTDDWNAPVRAADLTENWLFNGGGSVEDIYARLRTGLDGTPMPTFTDAVEGGIITDEQLWRIAQYVRSLAPDRPPAVREVVRAHRVEDGLLPASPMDSAWVEVERFYIPLVGQIIVRPRWFAPSVDGVWVQALHDDTTLALRLVWHDPSRSPDPAWDEWLERIRAVHTDADGPPAESQGPDRFVVQFPSQLEGERPFFLGGSARRPAHGWRWTSTPDVVEEGVLTGLGRFAARQGASDLRHQAVFEDGAWHLQLVRTLVPTDTAAAPTLAVGRAIPIAFYAADGSSGEDEMRGAVSAWYAIYLDVPTPRGVYIAPLTTMLLTAGLGLVLVRQAQRRGRAPERPTSEES